MREKEREEEKRKKEGRERGREKREGRGKRDGERYGQTDSSLNLRKREYIFCTFYSQFMSCIYEYFNSLSSISLLSFCLYIYQIKS